MAVTMKVLKFSVLIAILGAFLLMMATVDTRATLKFKKETGKKCTFCHTGIPESGDEDPQLTEDGKKFRDNDYKLTEEQKRRPSSSVAPLAAH